MTLATHIARELQIEEIRCQALDAECGPIASRARSEIGTQPALKIEIGRDGAVLQKLLLPVIGKRSVRSAYR
jgi:hypothetical protein